VERNGRIVDGGYDIQYVLMLLNAAQDASNATYDVEN